MACYDGYMHIDPEAKAFWARKFAASRPLSIEDCVGVVAPNAVVAVDRDLMVVTVSGVTDDEYEAIERALPLTVGLSRG